VLLAVIRDNGVKQAVGIAHSFRSTAFKHNALGTLQNAFETLRDLAIENGASPDIELIQMREKDKIILFGLPGTLDKMKDGSFPPPPPPSSSSP